MKILIIGAGVIGHVYAMGLDRSGHDVTVMGRNRDTIDRLNREGIEFLCLKTNRCETVNLKYACAVPPRNFDLIVITIRNDHLCETVVEGLSHLLNDSGRVLLFHLGFSGPGLLSKYLPRHRVLIGYAMTTGGYWDVPARRLCYHVPTGQNSVLGSLGLGITSDVSQVAQLLMRAGFICQLARSMPDNVYQTSAIVATLAAFDRRYPSFLDGSVTAQLQEILAQAFTETILVIDCLRSRSQKLADRVAAALGSQQAREFAGVGPISRTLLTRYFRGNGGDEMSKLYDDVLNLAARQRMRSSALESLSV